RREIFKRIEPLAIHLDRMVGHACSRNGFAESSRGRCDVDVVAGSGDALRQAQAMPVKIPVVCQNEEDAGTCAHSSRVLTARRTKRQRVWNRLGAASGRLVAWMSAAKSGIADRESRLTLRLIRATLARLRSSTAG